jgi:hypothetical protein
MLPRHDYRILVVADTRYKDTGNYWRDRFMTNSTEMQQAWESYAESKGKPLGDIETSYKGTRSDKTDLFWRVFHIGWDYVSKYFPTFTQEGFEADDIAGAIYRVKRKARKNSIVAKRQLFLSTLDRDWSQLVDDELKIYFANTRHCFPREKIQERLVGNQGVIEHTLHKMGFELDHPRNLANWKVLKGDLGDNLPPGSPHCLFDLCEPHTEYVIENAAAWYPDLVKELSDKRPNILSEHFDKTLAEFAKICLEAPVKL